MVRGPREVRGVRGARSVRIFRGVRAFRVAFGALGVGDAQLERQTLEENVTVGGPNTQVAAALANRAAQHRLAVLAVGIDTQRLIHARVAVTRFRVEIRAQAVRQIDDRVAVARHQAPVLADLAARQNLHRDRAVVGARTHEIEAPIQRDAAVARHHVAAAVDAVQADAAVVSAREQVAAEIETGDAPVARPQLDPPLHLLDRNRTIAAAQHDVAAAWDRGDQLGAARHRGEHAERVFLPARLTRFQRDAIALLIADHLDLLDRVLLAAALLDLDEDLVAVPAAHVDRAVKGGQVDLGSARHLEPLLLAGAKIVRIHPHDARPQRQRRQHGARHGHLKTSRDRAEHIGLGVRVTGRKP